MSLIRYNRYCEYGMEPSRKTHRKDNHTGNLKQTATDNKSKSDMKPRFSHSRKASLSPNRESRYKSQKRANSVKSAAMLLRPKAVTGAKAYSSRLLLPQIPSGYGNQPDRSELMAVKTAHAKIRPPSGISSGDDSEIKEFKRKIRENKEMMRQQRLIQNGHNSYYFCQMEGKKLKVLVSRELAKVNKKLYLNVKYPERARSSSPWALIHGDGYARNNFRKNMYRKLYKYIADKHPKTNNRYCTSDDEVMGEPSVPLSFQKAQSQTELRTNSFYKIKSIEPIPAAETLYKYTSIDVQPIRIQYGTTLKTIDFKSEFDRFSKGMERTQKCMQDYLRNGLLLLYLETDMRYREAKQYLHSDRSSDKIM